MQKVYFGHPIVYYGTETQTRLIACISEQFPGCDIINPDREEYQEGYRKYKIETGRGMNYFFAEVLPDMDTGVFLPFKDGMFGKGVFDEAEFLAKNKKPVHEINLEGEIKILEINKNRALSVEDTAKRLESLRLERKT